MHLLRGAKHDSRLALVANPRQGYPGMGRLLAFGIDAGSDQWGCCEVSPYTERAVLTRHRKDVPRTKSTRLPFDFEWLFAVDMQAVLGFREGS